MISREHYQEQKKFCCKKASKAEPLIFLITITVKGLPTLHVGSQSFQLGEIGVFRVAEGKADFVPKGGVELVQHESSGPRSTRGGHPAEPLNRPPSPPRVGVMGC